MPLIVVPALPNCSYYLIVAAATIVICNSRYIKAFTKHLEMGMTLILHTKRRLIPDSRNIFAVIIVDHEFGDQKLSASVFDLPLG